MKTLLFLISFITSSLLHAQMTSGTLSYTMTYGTNDPHSTKEKIDITFEFNENYLKWTSKSRSLCENFVGLHNLKTKKSDLYIDYRIDKMIQFMDGERSSEKSELGNEENQESAPSDYSKDFYRALLDIPLNDTVVYHSKETKTILGYLCKKEVLKIGKDETQTYWVTDEIKSFNGYNGMDKYFTGTYLEVTLTNAVYSYTMEATEVKPTHTLKENEVISLPEGYRLFLGEFPDMNESDHHVVNDNYIPEFVSVGDHFEENQKKIVDAYVQFYDFSEEAMYDRLTIEINPTGNITKVDGSISSSEAESQKLLKAIQKKCVLDPVTLYGKAVPCRFELENDELR